MQDSKARQCKDLKGQNIISYSINSDIEGEISASRGVLPDNVSTPEDRGCPENPERRREERDIDHGALCRVALPSLDVMCQIRPQASPNIVLLP